MKLVLQICFSNVKRAKKVLFSSLKTRLKIINMVTYCQDYNNIDYYVSDLFKFLADLVLIRSQVRGIGVVASNR
jgi:hypothetical protein